MMAQEAGIADESLLILLRHCRDMKRQELHLRLVTLLLLLCCTGLFLLTNWPPVSRPRNSGDGGREGEGHQSPAYAMQQSACPTAVPPPPPPPSVAAEIPPRNQIRLHAHLHLLPEVAANGTDKLYLRWDGAMHRAYDPEKRAVVVPEQGFYFVYVRMALSCQQLSQANNFHNFHMALHSWNPGYNSTMHLMKAYDGLSCSARAHKSFFVGRLFDLLAGDHVSVWIEDGYRLITRASFGIYRT